MSTTLFNAIPCACGYPLKVGLRWTGSQYRYLYFDGSLTPTSNEQLTHCPACQAELPATADLRRPSLAPRPRVPSRPRR